MTLEDFRSTRTRLRPEDFAISEGLEVPPSELISEDTWKSITSLPDDVSVRTSDHYGETLTLLWNLCGQWSCVVGGLQATVAEPKDSPIAHAACDATDFFQASIYNALIGYYRLGYASLRAVVENLTFGMAFQLTANQQGFADWLRGEEISFNEYAMLVSKHPKIAPLEQSLLAATGDNLYRERKPSDAGGFVRRLFKHLSKYAHGIPGKTEGDIWQSNGPILVPTAFEAWSECYLTVYALAVLQCRLAQPALDKLPWEASFTAKGPFCHAVQLLPTTSEARRLFDAVPPSIW